jgi:hypothetical protein
MAEHGRVTSTMLDFAFRIAVFDRMQDAKTGTFANMMKA